MADYGYEYITKYTSNHDNWKSGRDGHKVTGITIHHWGSSHNLDYLGIVTFLCSYRPNNPTSAHYVAQGVDQKGRSARKVACIVDPDDTAYHAGNWTANLTNIGIECRPYPTAADYDVVAEVVARLWLVYGKVPLYPHRHWTSTECPGHWDVNRVGREAEVKYDALRSGKDLKGEVNMSLTSEDVKVIANTDNVFLCPDVYKGKGNDYWTLNSYQRVTLNNVYSVSAKVSTLNGKVDGLIALVQQVLASTGKMSDDQLKQVIDAVSAASEKGASEAMATLDASVTLTTGGDAA